MGVLAGIRKAELCGMVRQNANVTEKWACRNEIPEKAGWHLDTSKDNHYITFSGEPISFTMDHEGLFNSFRRGDKVTIGYVPVSQSLQGKDVLLGYKLVSVDRRDEQNEKPLSP